MRMLGMDGIVVEPQDLTDLVEYFWRIWLTFHNDWLIFKHGFGPETLPGSVDLETR